jgi:environmental stress-induced protein Ves
MPWRNGLGSTVEILKRNIPDSEDFAWRISMANVATDGPFSGFDNYDRTLLLLAGNGITLDITNGEANQSKTISLTKPLQSAGFRGDDPTVATLHDGPITDFNIMTHRDYCDTEVVCGHEPEGNQIDIDCNEALIYCVIGELSVESESGEKWALAEGFSLHLTKPAEQTLVLTGGNFIAIQIRYKNAD